MTESTDIERALAHFDSASLEAWNAHWDSPEPPMFNSSMMLFHPGSASDEKKEILAYFWAAELDERERRLLSRLPISLAATIVLRCNLEAGSALDEPSLDEPSSASLRRIARAKGCARVLFSGLADSELFGAPPWIRVDAPAGAASASSPPARTILAPVGWARRQLAFFRAAPSSAVLAAAWSTLFLATTCSAIFIPAPATILAASLGTFAALAFLARAALFQRRNKAFAARAVARAALLAEAYPDLDAERLFQLPDRWPSEHILSDQRSFGNASALGPQDDFILSHRPRPEGALLARLDLFLQTSRHASPMNRQGPAWNSSMDRLKEAELRAGARLSRVLSESPGSAWPNERLALLRERLSLEQSSLPAGSRAAARRL